MAASRRVTKAVTDVIDLAPRKGEVTVARLVTAVGERRGRPIAIRMAELPSGVCGQWRQYADDDVFLIQQGLPTWDRKSGSAGMPRPISISAPDVWGPAVRRPNRRPRTSQRC